ncbi:MAG TPA: class II aldolase/adducin family protein [Usitatibacter sp.]|nr:class II aldolase/adducin family protein [Usitatibacter sp.]
MINERGLRMQMVTAARRLSSLGMNPGRSGNLSARVDDGFVVTPSGAAYDSLHPDDLVFLGPAGEFGGGQRTPSSEWRLHRDIFANRPDAGAVVHTHSPYATTLACLGRGIPSFHYEVAFAGGRDIRCAPYATFGTQGLSDNARAALDGRKACLMSNHGVVALGDDLEAAVGLAEKVEALARLYWQALQVGEPLLLDGVEMDQVVEKFKGYGRGQTT